MKKSIRLRSLVGLLCSVFFVLNCGGPGDFDQQTLPLETVRQQEDVSRGDKDQRSPSPRKRKPERTKAPVFLGGRAGQKSKAGNLKAPETLRHFRYCCIPSGSFGWSCYSIDDNDYCPSPYSLAMCSSSDPYLCENSGTLYCSPEPCLPR